MTLHVPALPIGVEPHVADAATAEPAARRRLATALAVLATMFAVLVISVATVALELAR